MSRAPRAAGSPACAPAARALAGHPPGVRLALLPGAAVAAVTSTAYGAGMNPTRRHLRHAHVLAALVAILAAAAWLPAAASAAGLPTLLSGERCVGHPCSTAVAVYEVRPHTVEVAEAYGGTLTLHWSSWTRSAATGSGTSVVSGMGLTTTLPIEVRAWRVRSGRFTRLTITDRQATGPASVETLHLTSGPEASWIS